MNKKYMLLWFEGPLQSWGSDSKFGRRETEKFPTKSGIYGMFLAAMGAQGPQIELLETLSKFKQTVYSCIRKEETGNPTFYERTLDHPILMDFHMIGSGYNEKDEWERMLIPKKSDGSSAVGGGAKMTYRKYLQDSKFAVIQELDSELSTTIAEALANPVFDLYLGRKNCCPTDFIYRGTYNTFHNAVSALNELLKQKNLKSTFFVTENVSEGEEIVLNDVPIQFGTTKKYRDRTVAIIMNA